MYRIPVFILLFTLSANGSFAQKGITKKRPINLTQFDEKFMHFGFSLGINSSDFFSETNLGVNDSLLKMESNPQLGFNLGIVADLHIGTNANLRFIPTLSFSQRNLEYTFREGNTLETKKYVKPVESTYIDFPLNLKLRSNRHGNFAAYVVGGGMYSYDLVSQEGVSNTTLNFDDLIVKVNRHTISYQVGAGFDFFLEYFKFSPEFKFSGGINNNHVQDGTVFSAPINYLKSRIFLISLTFEG